MATSRLFEPFKIGKITLNQRIAMAPLTRFRATSEHVPSEIALEYYSQRASVPGTLIITEGTLIAPRAGGYKNVPGIWSEAQIESWKKIVDAVHEKSSFIFLQLWALGRGAFQSELEGEDYVSASATPIKPGDPVPRELTKQELKEYVQLYVQAAKNAVEKAGFDGVELHSANGYLPDQFLQDTSNQRTDEYGGSVENRARFPLEVMEAISGAVGQERVGFRVSPWSTVQGMGMEDPKPTFSYFVETVRSRLPNIGYLHVTRPQVSGDNDSEVAHRRGANDFLHKIWHPKPLLVAGGISPDTVDDVIQEDNVVAVFGRWFISNPDLPGRLRHKIPFSPYNRMTFYLHGPDKPEGYTDYATADHSKA
jgi:NADPH2 dehydrogenase